MISPRRSLADVNPNNALLWGEFRTQYLLNGLQVTDNLGRYPGAPKTLLMGDGTTVSKFPTQLVGRRGLYFPLHSWVDTRIIDPFERTDKFSIFVVFSNGWTSGALIGDPDTVTALVNGIGIFINDATSLGNFIRGHYSDSTIDKNFASGNNILVNSTAIVYNGNSNASGLFSYFNNILHPEGITFNNLSSTIKTGRAILIGSEYNGSTPDRRPLNKGIVYFAAIFPWDLTPQQIQYLDRLVRTKINQP